jgi:hypothetical protein
MIDRRCFYYVFIVVVIRYETTAAAGWTLMFIVRAFINYTITVAIWTSFSFHLCLMWMLTIHDRPVPARGRHHCIDATLSVLFLSELANVSLKPSRDTNCDPDLDAQGATDNQAKQVCKSI